MCIRDRVAAANPSYVDEAAVPAEVVAKEKEILLAQMANDPKNANKPDAVKQKTAYEILRSDWSSDVCSSDLAIVFWTSCGDSTSSA